MSGRFNTIAGWVLGAGIVALGLTSLSGHYFRADKDQRPEKLGYPIAGVVAEGGAAAAVPIETLLAKADPNAGQQVFQKCAACHTVTQGGPMASARISMAWWATRSPRARRLCLLVLAGGKGGKWDFKSLDTWLTNPRGFADGTKMTFAGLDSPEDRANVIVYLNKQGSNVPLPAAPAAGAALAGDAKAADAKGEAKAEGAASGG